NGSVLEIAGSRHAGISEVEQFAPLPSNLRKKYPRLSKKMAKFYKKYRNDVAMPVFSNISRAENLVVLVDIPSLLAGGVGRYNDNRQILLDLFEVLRSKSDIGAMLMKYFTFWQKSLSRIAFVAGKADMVHPMDIENKRMINLLKMMTDRAARMLPDVKSEWFVCSACHSTYPVEGMPRLKGKIAYDNPEKEFKEYNVPELPEAWPENWNPGDYPFYRVYPDAPRNYLIPPKHLGLDRVFEFIS
ncbi:MAG: YcjX family protein, partial [Desulfovibrionales bacterium]|nr:YcjX family protein [Desulfovibrionales bacterium]